MVWVEHSCSTVKERPFNAGSNGPETQTPLSSNAALKEPLFRFQCLLFLFNIRFSP